MNETPEDPRGTEHAAPPLVTPGPDAKAPGEVRRLHPTSVLFSLLGQLRRWVFPLIVLLLFSKGDRWELWFMLLILPSTLYEAFRYLTVRYRFAASELIVRDGLLNRNERHIPFHRIQNVDLVQGPLQQLFGVAEVRIETASGKEAEAVLRVLSLADVEEMRRHIFAERDARDTAAEVDEAESPRQVLVALGPGQLLMLGLINNRGMALILAGLGLAYEFDLWDRIPTDAVEPYLEHLDLASAVSVAAGTVFGVVLLTFLFSIAWTFVRLHRFRLERVGDDFRFGCGLFTRLSATIPRQRIQFVSIHENLRHRLFRCVSVRVETAGSGAEEKTAVGRRWFVPLMPRAALPALLREIDPALDPAGLEWQPLAPRARRRMLRLHMLAALLITVLALAVVQPWGGLALAVLGPLLWIRALADWRFTRYAVDAERVAFRSGAFHRKTSLTLPRRVQVISVRESPFDRHYGMAQLAVDTAGAGMAQHTIHVRYLARDVALNLQAELAGRAEAGGFRW